ncbi:MAG: trimeric intracellular cation channel family protein [Firmicutes bacterium]|nr:trimeric intracellular cation channel family protein [Bacillota bacterium]
MSDTLILIFELIGTVAFSASGAMTGIKKRMDILGVIILGLTTAVGGGVIRDLILGNTPPNTFRNPIYATVAIVTAVIVFMPQVYRLLSKNQRLYDYIMLWMDSLGLGIFTVVGIQVAHSMGDSIGTHSAFLMLFVGVVTGVGGGVLRDVMAGDRPYIFVKHFYATASLCGAAAAITLWHSLGSATAMIAGTVTVVVLRILAAKFHWSLPKLEL